ncbi:MAG: CPBP family intramembrane metalloprotease [Bacteroidetes bacterium]|nr:CPBP family intramembrane metalloprotease [Bacteroidota bacterium]MBU1761795.1 CPBP family intramembrane metalloprotease [Bacteroidota bacterium]
MIDTRKSTAYHPALLLVFLVLISAVAAIVFALIGTAVWFFTDSNASLATFAAATTTGNIAFIRILQIFSTFGLFIVGPIAYSFLSGVKAKHYFCFDEKLNWNLFFVVLALMFCSNALLEWITALNQKMSLPDVLHGMELWMKQKEDEAAELTKMLLVMKDYSAFSINLLMIAILPAIGEELFFRGGIQNILIQWFKNHHVAIWVTAILFSAIHLQFYGFFPRMFLGALFGYLMVYDKSIWYAILGHFLNNGTAVVMAFVMQKQGKSLEEIDKTQPFEWYGYLISAIITLILLIVFFKIANKEEKTISYE